MLTSATQPLESAARVLLPSTMTSVRQSPSFTLQGWKILDRWALNSPDKLRSLEAQGELMLLGRLMQQQEIEQQVLTAARRTAWAGLSEMEIMQQQEIHTDL